MKILLTNDDGFNAIGINVLDEVLTKAGHDVWICAPTEHKSSTSHSLSFTGDKKPVEIEKNRFSFDGQPSDCMMKALGTKAISFIPDIVISGINSGFNLSIDILYSGTCGAASEASLWGYKAIAISAEKPSDDSHDVHYKAANFLLAHLNEFITSFSNDVFLNINVPLLSDGKEWEIGKSLTMVHRDSSSPDDRGVLLNGRRDIERGVMDSDLAIAASGKISVSPIAVKPTVPGLNIEQLEALLATSNKPQEELNI